MNSTSVYAGPHQQPVHGATAAYRSHWNFGPLASDQGESRYLNLDIASPSCPVSDQPLATWQQHPTPTKAPFYQHPMPPPAADHTSQDYWSQSSIPAYHVPMMARPPADAVSVIPNWSNAAAALPQPEPAATGSVQEEPASLPPIENHTQQPEEHQPQIEEPIEAQPKKRRNLRQDVKARKAKTMHLNKYV